MGATDTVQLVDHAKALGKLISIALPAALVLYVLATCFYNFFFHPLRSYPGPFLWRITRIPYDFYTFNGTLHHRVVKIHKAYGPTVRVNPNELSFTSSQAKKDILAHFPGREEFPKDPSRAAKTPNGLESILLSRKDNHSRFRKLLSNAFSDKGLRDQEPHIRRHVDLLIDNLTKRAKSGDTIDMVDWYNMITFDVIGELGFGRSFNCLKDGGRLHEWIPNVSKSVKYSLQSATLRQWGLGFLEKYLLDEETRKGRISNFRYAQESVDKRMEHGADRGDFWDRILIKSEKNDLTGEGMSPGEMLNNAVVLVLGGSETSATALSGATYLLLKHQETMRKVVQEVRSKFEKTEDITLQSVHELEYLSAVLEETMRLYPPVASQQPRIASPGGGTVLGELIPEGTTVNPHQLAANKMEWNFHFPDHFVPERWLPDLDPKSDFAKDDLAACQPFSLGTRNCIGKNLAFYEMRIILAKVLYHFDISAGEMIDPDWFDQKSWAIRWKKPVWVKLRVADHE